MIGNHNVVSVYIDGHTFLLTLKYRCSGPKRKQINKAKKIMREINKQKIVNKRYQRFFKQNQ